MFQIDSKANRITKLKEVRFSELGFSERGHLQEWLANKPDALGEPLLVIQKEFAGFDETKERLDLLALDKTGGVVVVENKLDDSGRDVVWQGLKYASYCSTLSKTSIADIYQEYLDKSGAGGKAEERICEFLEQEDFKEVVLNSGNDQRLILVAAHFRKEVTSTVLWLLKHDVHVQCFRATPFKLGDALLLNLEQVIPLPEAAELMIGISQKEKEERNAEQGQVTRHELRHDFWHRTLEALSEAGIHIYENVSPSKDHWLNAGWGFGGSHFTMIFSKDEARVEFVLHGPKARNKQLFDYLLSRRPQLETRFGEPLGWRKLDDKIVSMIVSKKAFDGYNKEAWPDMIRWLVEHVKKMEGTIAPELEKMKEIVKATSVKDPVTAT
jgi:hypothetical protein